MVCNYRPRNGSSKNNLSDIGRLKLIAETDNMAEVIQQRKKDIGQIESIMQNINAIAKDINVEVQVQGEKLERLDQHMRTAADNVVGAKGELT